MKKILNKKFLSAIAVLAVSGTVAIGAAACEEKNPNNDGGNNGGEVAGSVYYVAADGKRDNDGKTIATAKDPGFINDRQEIQAGDTVYLVPGTYKWDTSWGANISFKSQAIAITASGTPNKRISFINAALDEKSGYTGTETKVTLDFSAMAFDGSNRGVQIYGDYIYWYGIDVCGAGDNGLYVGGSYNTIEYCEFYNNRDTGLQLGRQESAQTNINQWPSYNLIKNCTSHNNYDDETFGENADGFAAKLTVGYGNVFDGCIAYRNSDDGWDLYAKSDSGNIGCVIIYNSVAFENGYLEYTQKENHERLNYNSEYNEPVLDSYKTRDGDGNGFKLGGSVMEGDVKMYNCLAFQNRMHGVTDNSNPGYLMIEGVTSYDNSAAIDDNPSSATFGKVIATKNIEAHGNIDVARQTYSYNTVKNVLSVKSPIAQSLDNDAYRGSVSDSLLVSGSKTNVVKGSVDADTKVSGAKQYTSQVDLLKADDVFKKLPVVAEGDSYTYNIDGTRDLDNAAEARIHNVYRNADHSINMGEILAVKDDFDFSTYFGAGVTAGSYLNKGSWAEYTHFADENLFEGVSSEIYATLLKAKETLTINTDGEQVYQDFEVPVKLLDATVEWSTTSDLLEIGKQAEVSFSKSEYITIGVTRPVDGDVTAKLTAKIYYLNYSITKEFNLVIKKDIPSIGGLSVRVAETDAKYVNGGKIIIDEYRQYAEPVLEVENGAYYNGTLLTAAQYTVDTVYEYATSASAEYVKVHGFMVNHPGVYRITHNVTLADGSSSASMTYQIFVASPFADVDFDGAANVSVYRDGYIIAGDLTNVTGSLYTLASDKEIIGLTGEQLKANEATEKMSFKATDINFSFNNANSGEYYIYYALANANDDVTSEVYCAHVEVIEIGNTADFLKLVKGDQLKGENIATTIYLLTSDLDFTGVTYAAKGTFTGLLNGNGHTIEHVTINSSEKGAALFKSVKGGTIMNVKFNDIKIKSTAQQAGIVGTAYGGYFHNIAITNILVESSDQRIGGLIGQAFEGATNLEISMISLVNPIPALDSTGRIDEAANAGKQLYYISSSSERAGGIIGLVQSQSTPAGFIHVVISDCYVESYIATAKYTVSSIVAGYDAGKAEVNYLEINNCVSAGVLISTGSSGRIGGMLGYHQSGDTVRITSGVSIHDMYYGNALLEVSQKNQSMIVGNFNTAADVLVSRCIALMEEYNTDYDVSAYTLEQLTIPMMFGNTTFDLKEKWSFVFAEGSTTSLARPFLQLHNIGNPKAE